ncbi:hypothetical protein [Fluviicola taffensis]|uniref:Uncharacterized protein n=1 Tax=Fluviicola taffensis (strain DSM 16823 / NCIMB 13979 / RW262) TaxID=755732 RepID=F2IFX4_FLUTR|nr:hypothetical protein [Fluviicola taffensis]AEA43595.1 hypothetical protein Fluta_1603 [Fluviicola taffensis DSM 16823]
MKWILLIILIYHNSLFAQQKDPLKRYEEQEENERLSNEKQTLGARGLNRLFIDGVIGFGFLKHIDGNYNYKEYTFTSDFRIGNNFYIGQGKSPFIIRVTYFRFGANFGDFGIFPYFVPPQLGLGKHFRIKTAFSIEPTIHFGYLITSGDPYGGDITPYGYFFMPEVKLNFSRFSIGFEFTMRKFVDDKFPLTKYDRNYYFGFSLGRRIGKGL